MKKTLAALVAASALTANAQDSSSDAYAELMLFKQRIDTGQVEKAKVLPNIDRDLLELVNEKHGYMFTLFVGATIK